MAIRSTQSVVEVLSRPTTDFNESITSTLVLTQSVNESFPCISQLGTIRSLLSSFCLGSSAFIDEPLIVQENILQTIALTQFAQDVGEETTSIISVVQSVQVTGPFYEDITQTINLTQAVLDPQDYPFSITDLISLTQLVDTPIVEALSNTLTLVQFLGDNSVEQILTLTQTVDDQTGPGTTNQLAITQNVVSNLDANHSLSNTITLTQKVLVEHETSQNLECIYAPQVGTGSFPTEPVISKSPTMTLTHPFVSPTTTITIRSPEFGNRDTLEYQRIKRETTGGELTIFRDPSWPQSQILTLEVLNICGDDLEALLSFFKTSLGQDVGLLDYEGRQWKGIILTPEADKTEVGPDRYSLSFEFQGELQ